jgi:hypothetical protein
VGEPADSLRELRSRDYEVRSDQITRHKRLYSEEQKNWEKEESVSRAEKF